MIIKASVITLDKQREANIRAESFNPSIRTLSGIVVCTFYIEVRAICASICVGIRERVLANVHVLAVKPQRYHYQMFPSIQIHHQYAVLSFDGI